MAIPLASISIKLFCCFSSKSHQSTTHKLVTKMANTTPTAPPRTDSMDNAAISVADWQSRYSAIVPQRRTKQVRSEQGFTGEVHADTG